MLPGTIEQTESNTLELNGFINSSGAYLTDIKFEYGTTNTLGSSIIATPNYIYGFSTSFIKTIIDNPIENQTYYYRLVANDNGNTIYSDIYQYTTDILSLDNLSYNKQIVFFPNPTTHYLNIEFKDSEQISSIIINNALGQIIYVENNIDISKNLKIDMSNFGKGIYFLKVNFINKKSASKKIVKD
jgi:hypothetical protein